jgi:surfactin synthase thioesterase subunit
MTTQRDTWLQCTLPHLRPDRRLICFPHAGGSASFYRDWGGHLPGTEVYAVRYPGRAERIAEPPPTDMRRLGAEIAAAVAPLADRPLALFGHSMGAVVALETARSLEARGVAVAHLFASGSRNAPLPPRVDPGELEEDDESVAARLVDLGGTSPEMATDPLFLELVLPYVRSDTLMFHSYDSRPLPVLRCPVTTIVGDADPDADRRPWPELTGGPFRELVVRGDHFYLRAEPPYALIQEVFDAAPPPAVERIAET